LSGNDYFLGNGLASSAVGVGVPPVTAAFQLRSTCWKQSQSNAESHQASNLGRQETHSCGDRDPPGQQLQTGIRCKLRAFTLAKPLLVGLTYPYDWGFIPSTKAQDGDPVDVLVIHDAATYPGLVLRCKPIGVLEVLQITDGSEERNDRVFAVPERSPFEGDLQDVRRLPARAVEELEKFFEATDALENKKLKFLGWRGPTHAVRTIERLSR
jgi:inorganic pyrophosphatase